MMEPDILRIQTGALRLLLYAQGFRKAYGFLDSENPDRADKARWLTELVRQGVLEPERDTLRLQEPWRTWVYCLGNAQRAVQLDGPALQSAVCAYPLGDGVLLCSPLARSPQTVRFCTADTANLWQRLEMLASLPPQDRIPAETRRLTETELRKGKELFSVRVIDLPQGTVAAERLIVQLPLCKVQLGDGKTEPYDRRTLGSLLMKWREGTV